jgi:hypothetical protein
VRLAGSRPATVAPHPNFRRSRCTGADPFVAGFRAELLANDPDFGRGFDSQPYLAPLDPDDRKDNRGTDQDPFTVLARQDQHEAPPLRRVIEPDQTLARCPRARSTRSAWLADSRAARLTARRFGARDGEAEREEKSGWAAAVAKGLSVVLRDGVTIDECATAFQATRRGLVRAEAKRTVVRTL